MVMAFIHDIMSIITMWLVKLITEDPLEESFSTVIN